MILEGEKVRTSLMNEWAKQRTCINRYSPFPPLMNMEMAPSSVLLAPEFTHISQYSCSLWFMN